VEKNISDWVDKVSEKRPELDGKAICPFARKAYDDGKVFWSYINYEAEMYIESYIDSFKQDYELIAFINLGKNLTNDECISIIKSLNKKYSEIIFLKDHPDDPGYIKGLFTGNGEFPIILAQPKDKLNLARQKLLKTGYYKFWDEEYRKEIWSYGYES
jgi:hypothetical protein